jgi:hypothetical protein
MECSSRCRDESLPFRSLPRFRGFIRSLYDNTSGVFNDHTFFCVHTQHNVALHKLQTWDTPIPVQLQYAE